MNHYMKTIYYFMLNTNLTRQSDLYELLEWWKWCGCDRRDDKEEKVRALLKLANQPKYRKNDE